MFLEKIKNGETGVLIYGITPPKADQSLEKIEVIAQNTIERIKNFPLDAIVIYDIQDETCRNADVRPFPFLKTLDPYEYADSYLRDLKIPKIIYKSVGKYQKNGLKNWLNEVDYSAYSPVFVGSPTKKDIGSMKLHEAYEIYKNVKEKGSLGAVTIFERHRKNNSEHLKIVEKMMNGSSYFITQCVFNISYAKDVLSDLYFYCLANDIKIPTIIFTLTICGSLKTLNFMEWLGINCPKWMKNELLNSKNILSRSIELSLEIAYEITQFCLDKSIPFGINVESVSLNKAEIEASIELLSKTAILLNNAKQNETTFQIKL